MVKTLRVFEFRVAQSGTSCWYFLIQASSKIRGAIWYSAVASGEFLPTKVNIDTNMLPQQVVTKKHPTMEKKWLHYCSYHCRSYDLSFQKLNFDLLCSKILLLTEFFTLLHTVWKFHDFSIIQILREINFGEYVEVLKLQF